VTVTPQLKAILIAGGLAALALALGFFTLSMNQPSSDAATPMPIAPLHVKRTTATAATPATAKAKPKPKVKPKPKPNPNVTAALAKGLPKSVAAQLGTHPVVVVELYSPQDGVDGLARGESQAGAAAAGAGFVAVNVDVDGDSSTLTKALGQLPPAPAALVYARPGDLFLTLPGFNDRTTVEQAAANANPTPTTTAVAATDWASQASALCKATMAKADALGGLEPNATLLQAKPKFDAIMSDFRTKVKALQPLTGTEADVAQVNALLAQNVQLIDQMLTELGQKDLAALGQTAPKQAATSTKLNGLWRKLGATGCTELA
jgi:hypothetical protein